MRPTDLLGYKDKPRAFLDIEIGGVKAGRLLIFLDWETTPFTAENFRVLATGVSPIPGQSYKGCLIHRVQAGFSCQGGDYENNDGTGGGSIYGRRMNDENLKKRFTHRGLVAMVSQGKNDNGSQFFITFDACPHLNEKAVIFGQLVDRESFEVLSKIEDIAIEPFSVYKPAQEIRIINSGEIKSVKHHTRVPVRDGSPE